jgi:tetratricopeptide (TPR) repeat protein
MMSEEASMRRGRRKAVRARSPLGVGLAAVAVIASSALPHRAWGDSYNATARANALWNEGRKLRDGGHVEDACPRFAQSNQLAPGVGVALDLADCFERLGRTTSAWYAFRNAEAMAREQKDARAGMAHEHVRALEAKLTLLTIAVGHETQAAGAEITLDKESVPPSRYNAPLAVDPGDHVVGVLPKGGTARLLPVHVDPGAPPVTVHAENAQAVAERSPPKPPAPEAVSPLAPADALFEEGKRLRDAGQVKEACSKFAQSQSLAPGVGIALHLGDCYERLGLNASAWNEFTRAEKDARDRNDKREKAAHLRAAALEPKLQRLTLVVPPAVPRDGTLIQIDGHTAPPETWNVPVPIDPGDHLVAFQAVGAERRTYPVHLDKEPALTVEVGDTATTATAAAEPAAAPSAPLVAPSPSTPEPAASADHGASTRRWVEIGLLGGAVLAAGVGAGLLVVKNDSMSNTGADGRPYVDPVAAAAEKIAFGAAGASALAAIVLYLTAPHAKDTGLSVSPTPIAGGAGAILHGSF